MPISDLKEQIQRLPEQPGVYLYLNDAGDTIYVGKARALRDRVRSYLGLYGSDPKRDALLDEVARLQVIVTDSVVEALARVCRHQPQPRPATTQTRFRSRARFTRSPASTHQPGR